MIGRFENALRRRVEHVRVVWRQHKRRNPLETMDHIDGPVSRIIERNGANVLHVLFVFIVADPSATFVIRVNDVPIARIGHNEAGFSATRDKPMFAADHA